MNIETEDFLEHYGVRGMHWGIRRDAKSGVRPIARALDNSKFGQLSNRNVNRYNAKKARRTHNRELNKQFKTQQKTAYVNNIDKSREYFSSGRAKAEYDAAKAQYKIDKIQLGSRHAKANRAEFRAMQMKQLETSQQLRDGKEIAAHVAKNLGSIAIEALKPMPI